MHSEFKQVFVTALEGFVPIDITKTLMAFLDFCYIARQDALTDDSLDALDSALRRFHHHRKIFQETGVRPTGFSLPRQHSLTHYRQQLQPSFYKCCAYKQGKVYKCACLNSQLHLWACTRQDEAFHPPSWASGPLSWTQRNDGLMG